MFAKIHDKVSHAQCCHGLIPSNAIRWNSVDEVSRVVCTEFVARNAIRQNSVG